MDEDMTLQGTMLIGGERISGSTGEVRSMAAATGEALGPVYGGGGAVEIERACALAAEAFDEFRETAPERRAQFLEAIADAVLALGDPLIERAIAESGLPRPRLVGELGRTASQLRLFAAVLREGSWLGVRIDRAQPDRVPAPRPDLRLRHIAIGPVVVFGASNFPLAFSVAGGDTASALAAGCPVIVKAHSAHLGTSEMVAGAIDEARRAAGLPAGIFQLLVGADNSLGAALVADARVKAVGFTGSRRGGLALVAIAAGRAEPIPVYAEMSSINPVLLFPQALEARGPAIAAAFIQSLTLGSGQFCTNPGLLVALDTPALDRFVEAATEALAGSAATTMLTPDIHAAYAAGVEARGGRIAPVGRGAAPVGSFEAHAHLFATDARGFLADRSLHEELFGPAALLVRCTDADEMAAVLEAVEGQLTIALHIDDADYADARTLLPTLERKAGRVLVNGFGTGVEVAHAMVHGGPFPATSDARTTSVGSLAIDRFLRPVCYQDMPDALLPEALREANPLLVPRRVEGRLELP